MRVRGEGYDFGTHCYHVNVRVRVRVTVGILGIRVRSGMYFEGLLPCKGEGVRDKGSGSGSG